jgi:AcrR family transcriptional regulator
MITKRTQNAATIRYAVVDYVINACRTKNFESIHVTDICEASNISKVTFFKYFDKKEDVLLLYKTILNYEICNEVRKKDLHSLDGISLIIERFVQVLRDTPSIAEGIIATLLNTKPPILPVILTESDKATFFKEAMEEKVSVMPFWDLIEGFMLEAILGKDVSGHANASDLTSLFISTLYGAIVTSHVKSPDQQPIYFNNVMKSWLRCV